MFSEVHALKQKADFLLAFLRWILIQEPLSIWIFILFSVQFDISFGLNYDESFDTIIVEESRGQISDLSTKKTVKTCDEWQSNDK